MAEPATELSSGYKLVPWLSWDQWNSVRNSIFSSNPERIATSLRQIAAWRSRGCLPVAVDVTAAIVEIQQKDPFFREESMDEALSSEELLAMLYCMAIVRFVNGFVEPSHKKTGRSISELADAIGIPRVLIDIRHECSHRSLPSLQLVRLSILKALDWLKSNYWEPQRKAIPDVQKEGRSRLQEMIYYLKIKNSQKLSSHGKKKRAKKTFLLSGCSKLSSQISGQLSSCKATGCEKKISKISKIIYQLYSAYPSELVSVLQDFLQLHASHSSDVTADEISEDIDVGNSETFMGPINVLRTIITKVSGKRPGLLLSILKAVLETIEGKHEKGQNQFLLSSNKANKRCQTKNLSRLVPWLLMNLKALKDSGQIRLIEETRPLLTDQDVSTKVSVINLLRKLLTLSFLGDKYLSNSVLMLGEMSKNTALIGKLKKLPLPGLQEQKSTVDSYYSESFLARQEASITDAKEKLESLKLRLVNRAVTNTFEKYNSGDANADIIENLWTIAKSWTPCPIGMLPCSFSSTAILPFLDSFGNGPEINHDTLESNQCVGKNEESETEADIESLETGIANKRLKLASKEERLEYMDLMNPMEGRLLIDGVWRTVSEEELLAIQSRIRIFVQ